MEITKPAKDGSIEDLTTIDFMLQSLDLGEVRHDTKVGLWKSTNEVIEEELEGLKLSKVRMKENIPKIKCFIRKLVAPLTSISGVPPTSDPMTTDIQAIISQLQEHKNFG